ncbi:hypothetical protein VTK73DRAFT_7216 [Phialemonium thermophilum]|uniref:ATP-dependent DNA helicase CHL1 n=1 Tax=Phialemonium thermophilum TaxID=223376 RepID=A0ABR3WGD1_9PEZI
MPLVTVHDASSADDGDTAVDFHHPYTPYDVQLQFMRAVYDVLEKGNGQVGILESPTGTGKSLSLICSALTWLRNHKRRKYEISISAARAGMDGEPDWIIESMLRRQREDLARRWEEREAKLARIRAKERAMEERGRKRRRLAEASSAKAKSAVPDEEAEFLLDDWNGGEDELDAAGHNGSIFSKETRALMEKLGMAPSKQDDEEDGDEENEVKIFYASRTHSQLSQFISELRRPSFPPSIPSDLAEGASGKEDSHGEGVKHVPLSSRQRLCINPSVSRLQSLSAINDRCSELQQPKSKDRCPFVPNSENLANTHQFRDTVLATVPDIEDLLQTGKSLQVCPYYASRTAIPGAEIVTLPYPLLLQKSARDALGIHLEGNVVIIDEAHNIMDAIASTHAAEIRRAELRKARQIVGIYVKKFGKRLKGENRVMVAQVVRVIDALSEWLDHALEAKAERGIVDPNLLLKGRGADQINLYRLIRYIQESKLAYKVEGYASHVEETQAGASTQPTSTTTPVLHTLLSFLAALTNLSTEGRIFYEKLPGPPQPDIKLSYLLLSPTHAFSSIATRARAVILAGGTMSPFDDYRTHLFPYLPSDKITTLSCGHVIPSSNLCVWTLASTRPMGPTASSSSSERQPDSVFQFSFQRRSDRTMIRQLGLALLNVCSVVPDGVVVFFPSYGYLDEVVSVWQSHDKDSASGKETKPLWERLQAKKAVFREAKGGSSDEVLQEYTAAILGEGPPESKPGVTGGGMRSRGALLLSVVGGKMSEGINFSDRLGRCVIVVGLPYPNINSPEWKARIEYVESSTLARLTGAARTPVAGGGREGERSNSTVASREEASAAAKQAARDFYENACMRAVNQSIGRAIRHRGDYAAIVLVDSRFGTQRIRAKLPGWIQGGMQPRSEEKGLPGLMGSLTAFFRGKEGQV